MSDEVDRFRLFLAQIKPLVKESGLPLKLLTDAVEVAFLQSDNEDWLKVDEYTEQWLKGFSTEQLVLIALAGTMKTSTPTTEALSLALRERAKSPK